MSDKPLLSICCVAYNHEKYIVHALDSFLMQKTNFEFEVVVGNDCSTDKTAFVVNEYVAKYPDKIRLVNYERNVGYSANTQRTLKECRGKYIAICDSDDYYTDPLKLQKQVDFLENNPQIGLVYSDFDRLEEKSGLITLNIFQNELGFKVNTFTDFLIYAWFLSPNTWVFRKELLSEINYSQYRVADLLILLDVASKSKIAYISDSMSIYRILPQSDSQGLDLRKKMEHRKGIYKIQMDFAEKLKVDSEIILGIKKFFISSGNIFWGGCLYNDLEIKKLLKEQWTLLPLYKKAIYYMSSFAIIRSSLRWELYLLKKIATSSTILKLLPVLKRIKF